MINIRERHEYWWNFLLEKIYVPAAYDRSMPRIKLTTRKSSTAGRACTLWCEYNLTYALQEGDKYDETICHEVCHTFANRLYRNEGHGTFWRYAFNVICDSGRGQYHHYQRPVETPELVAIKELLKLQKKLAACTKGNGNDSQR